jgi:SAM-dependent methyltransferase
MLATPSRGTPPLDPLELYRWAVQDPETHAIVLRIMYERLRPGRSPTLLREDFAGTSAESVAWVALLKGRRAVAIDLHEPTLAWARRRAERILGGRASAIDFITDDVVRVSPPRTPSADIIAALNFSILYFKDRDLLRAYFSHARQCLAPGGLLVLNTFGGPGARRDQIAKHHITPTPRLPTEAAIPPFEYIWEQRSFDAGAGSLDCRIHFAVPDPDNPGSPRELRDAFRYDWRLWTLPELTELLREAGFDDVQVWRHTHDASKGAAGVFLGQVPLAAVEPLHHWTAYIVATQRNPTPQA